MRAFKPCLVDLASNHITFYFSKRVLVLTSFEIIPSVTSSFLFLQSLRDDKYTRIKKEAAQSDKTRKDNILLKTVQEYSMQTKTAVLEVYESKELFKIHKIYVSREGNESCQYYSSHILSRMKSGTTM